MDIKVYLNRPHLDPDDVTGKAVLGRGAYAKLPEAEAEQWINKGWATPVDAEEYHAHLEAKQTDPVAYSKVQEKSLIEAKAQALAACDARKAARPSVVVLAKRKADLRTTLAAKRTEEANKTAAAGALSRAAGIVGGTPSVLGTDDDPRE